MSINFLDVAPGSRYYDEIMEATNTILYDGEPLLSGVNYSRFEKNSPYMYIERDAKKNQTIYTFVGIKIKPTDDNPLMVYADGIPWGYKSTEIVDGNTKVKLHMAAKAGVLLTFVSAGIPLLNPNGRPKLLNRKPYYPAQLLEHADQYVWWPDGHREYISVYGKRLKRLTIDPLYDAWPKKYDLGLENDIARKYIGKKTDVYLISDTGRIYLPWNLEGVRVTMVYSYNKKGKKGPLTLKNVVSVQENKAPMAGGKLHEDYDVYRNDRFFPDMYITRAEMVIALARLRRDIQARYTDSPVNEDPEFTVNDELVAYQGQKIFRINGTYDYGKGNLIVMKSAKVGPLNTNTWKLLTYKKDYFETGSHSITLAQPAEEGFTYGFYYQKTLGERFYDAGRNAVYYDNSTQTTRKVEGAPPEWIKHVLDLELEMLSDGSYLINGNTINNWHDKAKTQPIVNIYDERVQGTDKFTRGFFLPNNRLDKLDVANQLNRFRMWCLERFK